MRRTPSPPTPPATSASSRSGPNGDYLVRLDSAVVKGVAAMRGSGESYTDDRCLKEARQSPSFSGHSRSATVASSEASTER
jgi:hypothetical protein